MVTLEGSSVWSAMTVGTPLIGVERIVNVISSEINTRKTTVFCISITPYCLNKDPHFTEYAEYRLYSSGFSFPRKTNTFFGRMRMDRRFFDNNLE
jgi:hypothetical protein